MHWSEIDLDMGNWTISAERYKGRRAHLVPIPKGVGAIGCSDTVLVTDDGVETLTSAVPHSL